MRKPVKKKMNTSRTELDIDTLCDRIESVTVKRFDNLKDSFDVLNLRVSTLEREVSVCKGGEAILKKSYEAMKFSAAEIESLKASSAALIAENTDLRTRLMRVSSYLEKGPQ